MYSASTALAAAGMAGTRARTNEYGGFQLRSVSTTLSALMPSTRLTTASGGAGVPWARGRNQATLMPVVGWMCSRSASSRHGWDGICRAKNSSLAGGMCATTERRMCLHRAPDSEPRGTASRRRSATSLRRRDTALALTTGRDSSSAIFASCHDSVK